ncbi:OmpA family protein [Micromonospora sp. NPDC005237]|uniref:OmpA family protein n=1 Tax=unclassified Micromonospora TaxID=2617518 RepID=UPI0033A745A4
MDEPGETTGRTAFLVDVTNSTRAVGTGIGAPDYRRALSEFVRQAARDRDTVAVGAFSGTAADLSWTVFEQSTDWKRDDNNPDNQRDREREAGDCLEDAVDAAQTTDPAAPGTDILRPSATAADWLRQGKGAKRLVVATDGLVTEGCASLVRSDFTGSEEIAAMTAACSAEPAQELRPDVFDGITVTFVGIGHPAAGQPVPAPAQAQWLTRLWTEFCEFQGGDCDVRAASVGRDPEDPGSAPVAEVGDPVVRYGSAVQRYSLPAAALFDTDQTVLRSDAGPMLTELAVTLRTGAMARVQVVGFADPRGDGAHNRALSMGRAEAVAEFLRREGVPSVLAEGRGETNTCADGTGFPATATSDDETQCARRVDILASRAQGGT